MGCIWKEIVRFNCLRRPLLGVGNSVFGCTCWSCGLANPFKCMWEMFFFPGAVVFAFPIVICPPPNIRKFLVTSHCTNVCTHTQHFPAIFGHILPLLYSSFSHPLSAGKDSRRWTAFLKGFSWPAIESKTLLPYGFITFLSTGAEDNKFSLFSLIYVGKEKRCA